MILQATTIDGGISADWTLTISFGIIGFLIATIFALVGRHLIKTLDAITDRLNGHEYRINELEKKDIKHDAELSAIKK